MIINIILYKKIIILIIKKIIILIIIKIIMNITNNEQYVKEMFKGSSGFIVGSAVTGGIAGSSNSSSTGSSRNKFIGWLIVCFVVFIFSVGMFRFGIIDKVESETYKEFFSNHLLYYGFFTFLIVICSIYINKKEKFEYSKNVSEYYDDEKNNTEKFGRSFKTRQYQKQLKKRYG